VILQSLVISEISWTTDTKIPKVLKFERFYFYSVLTRLLFAKYLSSWIIYESKEIKKGPRFGGRT
jgi:hypothetical protein